MKKLAVLALPILIILNLNPGNTVQAQSVQLYHKPSNLKTQTATKSVLVRAIPRSQRLVLIANKALDLNDSDNVPESENLSLHVAYGRPEPKHSTETQDDEISDYVAVRLAVARARAIDLYRRKTFNQTAIKT